MNLNGFNPSIIPPLARIQDMVNKHLGLKFENVFVPPEGSPLQKGDVGVLRTVLFCDFMTQVSVGDCGVMCSPKMWGRMTD